MEARLYPVMYIWKAQNENNRAQMIWSLTLAFSPMYTFLIAEQKLEIEKLNTAGLITLSFAYM